MHPFASLNVDFQNGFLVTKVGEQSIKLLLVFLRFIQLVHFLK